MGPNPSRVAKTLYENYNAFAEDRESIFEVSPDEQAFSLEFVSPLFKKPPDEVVKPFNLPNENTIVDIMSDPVTFTQVTTPTEVWQDVVAPLFSGIDDTKPYMHQLLNAYYKFLKERPVVFMDNEDNRIHEISDERQMETQSLATAHSSCRSPQIDVNENLIKRLQLDSSNFQISSINDLIPGTIGNNTTSNSSNNSIEEKSSSDHIPTKYSLSIPNLLPSYHPTYDQITLKVCQSITDSYSAYVAIKWGFFAGDITPIFSALNFLVRKNPNERENSKKSFHYSFSNIQGIVENLPLENAIFFPHHKKLSHTTIINFKMPKTPSRSMMASNGKCLYVLGGHSVLTIISLSQFVNNSENRFRCFDFEIKKKKRIDTFIATSNGYLVVAGRFLDHEQIYSTQPFSKIEETVTYETNGFFRSAPKLVAPVACDGKYIYSLIKPKKIAVFSLDGKHIVFHRFIKLRKNGHELQEPFKHLIPKSWMDTANIYTNGVFFSFIVLKQSSQNRFEYLIRNFSLATGNHIKDFYLNLRWPIQSMIFDPWNDCLWALSPSKDDVNLLKMTTYGSMPPWMTGSDIEVINPENDLKKLGEDLKNTKTATSMMNTIIDIFYFIGAHYSGSLFDAIFTCPHSTYNVQMAQFLGSCTQSLYENLIDLIKFFIGQIKNKSKHNEWSEANKSEYALRMLFSIFQFNLANTEKRRESVAPKQETIDQIIDLMATILEDDSLEFIYYNAAFLIFSCFDFLFKNSLTKCPKVFSLIISKIKREDFIFYGFHHINDFYLLPYCISDDNCNQIVHPIFEKMILKPLELQFQHFEFISLLQSSLMLEMRRIYLSHPSVLPPSKLQIQKAFFTYSQSITKEMKTFIENSNEQMIQRNIKYSSFFRLFRKWLMFLQPLAKFSRVSSTLVPYLHSLFTPFKNIIAKDHKQLDDTGNDFSYTAKIFNELFSIYLDFISSLLNGGEELQRADQYSWLVRSTLDSQMNLESINKITDKFLDESTTIEEKIKILKDKWSSEIDTNTRNEEEDEEEENALQSQYLQSSTIELIANGISQKEHPSIKNLFDYLYSKVKSKGLKIKISDKDRYLERLIFFAFMRQLGFSNEVVQLNNDLLSELQPVLSHFIKMSVEALYRIRRESRSIKQTAIQNNNQNYTKFIINLKEKAIFLIYIQPCIQFQQDDIDSIFPEFLKRIQTFLLGKLSLSECFELIQAADTARKHISTGIELINDIIESKFMLDDLKTFMLDKLSASQSIMKYLTTFNFSMNDHSENSGFKNVMKLLDLLSKMIAQIPDPSICNTLIIFYTNFILTISKINADAINTPLKNLFTQLIDKKNTFPKQYFSSYIAVIISCIYAIFTESPHPNQSAFFELLRSILFPSSTLNESQLSVVRLCLSAGMDLPYTAESVILFIKTCNPSFYHPAFSLLFEVIRKSPKQMNKIFMFILKEIAQICSGAFSSLLPDSPTLSNATKDSKIVKTPGISLCACSDMIQICRKCLSSNGECKKTLISIIKYILTYDRNQENNENDIDKEKDKDENKYPNEYKVFQDPIYLFAVFAILSNAIDIFKGSSMIKDMSNNTIFFVENVDQKNSHYTGWQLPITRKSIQRIINFSPDLIPISLMPFTTELFPEYDLLIPFFKKAIEGHFSSNREDALDFYMLSSFMIYLNDKNFMRMFINEIQYNNFQFKIESISFDNSAKDFISILKMHLADHSIGFSMNQTNHPLLLHCSPAHISSNKNYRITANEVKCNEGTHVFISARLSVKHPTYLELTVPSPCQFNVGVHSFTQNPSISATYLYNFKNKEFIYNSCIAKTLHANEKMYKFVISFNPLKRKAAFFDNASNKLHSAILPSDKCCFIIQTFDPALIKYHISHVPLVSTAISSSNAEFLCPIAGNTVFKRTNIFKKMKNTINVNKSKNKKNKFVSPIKDVPFKDIIESSKIITTEKATFDSSIFSMSFVQMDESPVSQFTDNLYGSPFVKYPLDVLKECSYSLNTKRPKNDSIQQPTFSSIKYEQISNCAIKTPIVSYYEVDQSISSITNKFESIKDAICIDDNTGEVEPIDKCHILPVNYLQPFHPCNYPILPTNILNLNATGYVSKFRHKVKNQIFLQLIASPSIFNSSAASSAPASGWNNSIASASSSTQIPNLANSMDYIFDILKLSLQNVVEYSNYIMLFLEPVYHQLIKQKNSPINFSFNILDRNQMASSTKYVHKAALNNILAYYKAKDQMNEVIDIWFSYLKHQFFDVQNHFIVQNHPSASVFPLNLLKETKHVSIPGASSLIIFKTGFSRDSDVLVEVQGSSNKKNQSANASTNDVSAQGSSNVNAYINQGIESPIKISNNIAMILGDSLDLTPIKIVYDASIVILPVFPSSNESLCGTFFQLVVSYKYFIYFISQNIDSIDNNKIHNIRNKLYQLFIDSFIARSPFFYFFAQDVLKFLRTTLPMAGSDFNEEITTRLTLLAMYTDVKKYPFIGQFLEEQQMMWDEIMLLPLKASFPEFLTEADKREISALPKNEKAWGLPQPPLPQELVFSNDNEEFFQLGRQLKRMMKPTKTLIGYPFHLLIHLWCHYTSLYPPFETQIISDTLIQIKFLYYIPSSVHFLCGNKSIPLVRYSNTKEMNNPVDVSTNQDSQANAIIVQNNEIYLELTAGNSWKGLQFAFKSNGNEKTEDFIQKYRDRFVSDLTLLVLKWDIHDDEKILSCFPVREFSDNKISLEIRPIPLLQTDFQVSLHILTIRASLLFALNWILYYDKMSFDSDPSLKCLCQSMSMSLRMERFRSLIDVKSNDDSNEIQINRREAFEVRMGTSDDLKMTIIAQLTRCYKDPRAFRRRGDKPWRVTLIGESGIDAGGPARELVTEAAKDLVSPCCGLFVQVPNGRNDVGSNRDYVIPIADPRHTNALEQYKFGGVLIGICIRSGIVQDLNIAPFVWEYLASGNLTIEDIFSIDENYKVLIESLMEAIKSDIDELTFESKFNLRFVIYDSRGQEVPLTQRGRVEKVTFSNCSEFISLANEFRLGEMRLNLEAMRIGLWENLDFKPPSFATGEMIEFSACGNKEITYEAMKKIVMFENVTSEQKEFFLKVLETMTSKQRSDLLKFSTGRVRLPAQGSNEMLLRVDLSSGVKDRLPTASTCFNQFHMPQYSSFEKALKMITIAIEYTGTFENR